jgi:MFS family permease
MLSRIRSWKLKNNILKFYLYRVFSSLIFAMPIYVLFLQENGLNMTQIMILQSVYSATIMLAVVPSGILADYIGRKKVLIFNSVLFMIAWFVYASSYSFTGFLISEVIMALSTAMWMASGTAFFYDSLRELGKEGEFKKLFGNVVSINSAFLGIAALIGGYVATKSLRIPFWMTAVALFFAMLVSFSFTETKKYKHADKKYFAHLMEASKFALNHPKIRLLIIYSSINYAIVFTACVLYQPYLKVVGIPLVYFGLVFFAMNILAAFGSKMAYKIEGYLGEKKILIYLLVINIICFLGMTQEFLIVGAIFPIIIFFRGGIFEPVVTDYMNKHIESHHRATVLSLNTLVTQLLATVMAPFLGWIVDAYSLRSAFLISAVILAINLFILIGALTIINRRKR